MTVDQDYFSSMTFTCSGFNPNVTDYPADYRLYLDGNLLNINGINVLISYITNTGETTATNFKIVVCGSDEGNQIESVNDVTLPGSHNCEKKLTPGQTLPFRIERCDHNPPSAECNIVKVFEQEFQTPTISKSLNFTMDPFDLTGETTIKRLEIYGGDITASYTYKLKIDGWNGGGNYLIKGLNSNCSGDVTANIDSWTANSQGRIIIENVCDDGSACRNSCGEDFKDGKTYIISVYDLDSKFIGTIIIQSGLTKGPGGLRPGTCGTKNNGVPTALGCIDTDTAGFISAFSLVAFGLGFGIAFLMMVFGAIKILTSSGNPEGVNSGREIIISALTGLLFMIFGVFLLRLIGGNIFHFPIPGT